MYKFYVILAISYSQVDHITVKWRALYKGIDLGVALRLLTQEFLASCCCIKFLWRKNSKRKKVKLILWCTLV